MAYQFLWVDGFDEQGDLKEKYTPFAELGGSGQGTTATVPVPPYSYGRSARMNSSVETNIQKVLDGAPFTSLFVGYHWYFAGTPDVTERTHLQFWDNQNNLIQFEVRRIYDSVPGHYIFRLYRGSTLLASSATGVPPATWSWVSVKYVCDSTAGECTVQVNGNTVVSYSGNTRNGSVTQVHRAMLRTGSVVSEYNYDNLVIATGSPSDNPLPECRIFGAVVPTANSSIAFTPSAGTNWSNADDIPPNEDTDYNYSNTVGSTDVFNAPMPVINGVVYAVKINHRSRKDDAGLREIAPVIQPGSTIHQGATQSVPPNYFTRGYLWATNPDTGLAWTPAEILATKFGYRLVT